MIKFSKNIDENKKKQNTESTPDVHKISDEDKKFFTSFSIPEDELSDEKTMFTTGGFKSTMSSHLETGLKMTVSSYPKSELKTSKGNSDNGLLSADSSSLKITSPRYPSKDLPDSAPKKPSGKENISPKKPLVTSSKNKITISTSKDNTFEKYSAFRQKKTDLAGILDESLKIFDRLNMDTFKEKIKSLSNKVANESFKVQIVGTFKNGKSTFINSFLGENVLPAYALPCTAVINEVKYGEKKRAVLHFKNPLPDKLPEELSQDALNHMKKYPKGNIPPIEIPYDKIEEYVVIPMGKDPKDMLLESPYEKVELYWPLELLKNGIEIIDSPGLNEHATRTKVTMDYLSKADAIIFVLNATTLCSMDEMNFIENNLKSQGFEDLFFVINRFDLIPDKEKKRIMQYARIKLKDYTSFGEKGLFFMSAKIALDAKTAKDKVALKKSGLPAFESYLSDFLTKQKARMKLATPARDLNIILNREALKKIIPQQKEMLDTSVEELQLRYEQIKPRLKSLSDKKSKLYDKMTTNISLCKSDFRIIAKRNINDIIESVPGWVRDFTPTNKLGLFPTKEKTRIIVDEISSSVCSKIEYTCSEWQECELSPLMKQKSSEIFDTAQREIDKIKEELHKTEDLLSGKKLYVPGEKEETFSVSASVGTLSEDLYITKNTAMKTMGEALMLALSLVSPLALAGVLAMLFVGSKRSGESSPVKKLKDSVTTEIIKNLSASSDAFVKSVTESVIKQMTYTADKMVSQLDDDIRSIEHQAELAISDIKSGESSVNAKRLILKKCEMDISAITKKLDEFIEAITN